MVYLCIVKTTFEALTKLLYLCSGIQQAKKLTAGKKVLLGRQIATGNWYIKCPQSFQQKFGNFLLKHLGTLLPIYLQCAYNKSLGRSFHT